MVKDNYNGWTNYPTWLLSLWMENSKYEYDFWKEKTLEIDSKYMLSKYIEDYWKEFNETNKINGFYSDILNWALDNINYYEIACNLFDQFKKSENS